MTQLNYKSQCHSSHNFGGSTVLYRATICAYRKRILGLSGGIEEIGNVRWELALCLLLAWTICYFCVFNGVKSTGKVSAQTSQYSSLCWITIAR